MRHEATQFERFARAVHRRMILVRAAERIGLCVLISSAAAIMLLPILILRGESGLTIAVAMLAGGAIVGLGWTLVRRPSLMQSLTEADRQLDLHDLLGTAQSIRTNRAATPNAASWGDAVMAMAETRCAGLSPSSVVANRFGARAWGGIGLAAALVLTLAMIPTNPTSSKAEGTDESLVARTNIPPRIDDASSLAMRPSARQGFSAPSEPNPESKGRGAADITSDDTHDGNAARGDDHPNQRTPGASGGTGSGTSETRTSPGAKPLSSDAARTPRDSRSGELPAAGGAASDQVPHPGDDARSGRSIGLSHNAPSAPPWQSNTWPADRQAALQAVQDGRIPADCRDIVRNYFDRERE